MLKYKDLKLLPRRWFPLWTLDGYILREFLIKYSILMLVFVILFILGDVYRDISAFLEARASFLEILTYLAYKLPGNIRFGLHVDHGGIREKHGSDCHAGKRSITCTLRRLHLCHGAGRDCRQHLLQ